MFKQSLNDFQKKRSFGTGAALALDGIALITPGIPAAGKALGQLGDIARIADKIAPKAYTVYQGVDALTNEVKYVGITKRTVSERAAEHARAIGTGREGLIYKNISEGSRLNYPQARAVEQSMIDTYGLSKNGGTLLNKINSISPSSSVYGSLDSLVSDSLDPATKSLVSGAVKKLKSKKNGN